MNKVYYRLGCDAVQSGRSSPKFWRKYSPPLSVLCLFFLHHLLSISVLWRWRQYGPPKRRWIFNGRHGIKLQEILHLTVPSVRTLNPPIKGKAIRVTGRGGPWGCEKSRLPYSLANRLTDGGEVSLTRRPPFTPHGRFLVLISVRGWVDPRAIVRLEGIGQFKNPVTSSGIESATFRLVVQCLSQLRYRVPLIYIYIYMCIYF
jgi:hypothetical protein